MYRPRPIKKKEVTVISNVNPVLFTENVNTYYAETQGDIKETFCVEDGKYTAFLVREYTYFPEPERTIVDDFHDRGITYTCGNCHHLKVDHDKRKKYFPCVLTNDLACIDKEACERFYTEVAEGITAPRGEY